MTNKNLPLIHKNDSDDIKFHESGFGSSLKCEQVFPPKLISIIAIDKQSFDEGASAHDIPINMVK